MKTTEEVPESNFIAGAEREIELSLRWSKFALRNVGISLQPAKSAFINFAQNALLAMSMLIICTHIFNDVVYLVIQLTNSAKMEDIIPVIHTYGYCIQCVFKLIAVWYKKNVFRKLIKELIEIWPTAPMDEESQEIKDKTLKALRFTHSWYSILNGVGIWFYNLTPICTYFFQVWKGVEGAKVGFIWYTWYPFDKHHPIGHVVAYIFEILIGLICVCVGIGTDLLFAAMASHVGMLLKLLHKKLEKVAAALKSDEENYKDIVECIQLHQTLIKYCYDLEEAFSVSNFMNYVLSSINICCVLFVILLLEPIIEVSNKLFLCSCLIQMGMICWYGDNILHVNLEIVTAAYNSKWYKTSPKCRRALLFLIRRAQKPIAFTAMKFTNISLVTFSNILTRSYSYFALLYTIYNKTNNIII